MINICGKYNPLLAISKVSAVRQVLSENKTVGQKRQRFHHKFSMCTLAHRLFSYASNAC